MKTQTRRITYRIILAVLLLAVSFHAISGIWWLAIGWAVLAMFHVLAFSGHPLAVSCRKRSLLTYGLFLPGLFFFIIACRVLVFGIFIIPSSSMEKTILPGDIIWGSKLSYGPPLPRSPYEIPWVNLFTWWIEGSRADPARVWWDHKRFKGYRSPRPGDIVLFKQNEDVMIKRCMGTPGDTIRISDGRVTINNHIFPEPGQVLFFMRLVSGNKTDTYNTLENMGLKSHSWIKRANPLEDHIKLYLTINEIEELSRHPGTLHIGIEKNRPDTAWRVYPRHDMYPWTIDDFGPLVIPRKGMVIPLNHENWILYRRLINGHEKAGINADSIQFTKDGKIMKEYTFRHDYYFMLGDNRHDSRDSRYFGLVPEEMVICRAGRVLFSSKKKRNGSLRFMVKLR